MDTSRGGFRVIVATVFVVAVALYARTLGFDFTYLDDKTLILDQRDHLCAPSSLCAALGRTYTGVASDTYYRPLVNLSFAIDAQWSCTRPIGYHLTNSVLHATTSALVFVLLISLGLGCVPALFGALIFLAHPVHAGSVAWIPGRNDVLMAAFAVGGSILLLRDARCPSLAAKIAHLVCLSGALLSKETAFCLPLIWLILLWATDAPPPALRRRWMWAGWMAVATLAIAARLAVVTLPEGYVSDQLNTALKRWPVLLADLGKLLLPVKLQVLSSPRDLALWPGLVGVVLMSLGLLASGVRRRMLAAALALLLVPMLASLPAARHVVLENRLYLPTVGLAALAGEVLRELVSRTARLRRASLVVASGLVLVLGVVAVLHSNNYENRDRFSQAAILGSPNSSIAANLRFRRFYSRALDGTTHRGARPDSSAKSLQQAP
jgi:hypothetical protein